jgi:hypothetical protein
MATIKGVIKIFIFGARRRLIGGDPREGALESPPALTPNPM